MALFLARSKRPPHASEQTPPSNRGRISPDLLAEVSALEAQERHMAETVWAPEMLAQECARIFEAFWDALNASTNKLELAASFPVGELILGHWNRLHRLPHGIESRESGSPGQVLTTEGWSGLVEEFARDGWELGATEFRHVGFETDQEGDPRQSRFYFAAHLINPRLLERAILEGDLVVDWGPTNPDLSGAPVKRIDASNLIIKTRPGAPPFELLLEEKITLPVNTPSFDPLILYDLNGDGFSEIILAGMNLVYRRQETGEYQAEPLCRYPPGPIYTAIIADFDGDGAPDFLCVKYEGLFFYQGSPQGTFDEPGRLVFPGPDLKHAMVMTCGDIDRDGNLDLFIGQYKEPYKYGAMPTPYYDANDGYPAFLLLNDGHGNFSDATEAAGLGGKRLRRIFSASFADLDQDGHLDLVVVSDFAGVDLYRNDGQGRFTDVTSKWVLEPQGFGMGHALADFNADGRLDLLMIGMNSPTVDRLEHLNLWRPGVVEDRTMRSRMAYGNRLSLAQANGGFAQNSMSDSIARSGWSWGCSAFDFDNNGFPDVYIANGMESTESVRDYEPEYWLHDMFVGNSTENPLVYFYFQAKFSRTRGRGESYGGYERNRFYLNQNGASFIEAGHLLGISIPEDARNVVADDLDSNGQVDLIVSSFETWPQAKQTLRVYKNNAPESGNWIGFRFREEGAGTSPVGAQVLLRHIDGQVTGQIVTGDSYRSQHANTLHFGLGEIEQVERVEIRWASGQSITVRKPEVNRYHSISAPAPER
jgi:enediyne biosynthesis protein E4